MTILEQKQAEMRERVRDEALSFALKSRVRVKSRAVKESPELKKRNDTIRAELLKGTTLQAVAEAFGLTQQSVHLIIKRHKHSYRVWKEVRHRQSKWYQAMERSLAPKPQPSQ